MISWLKSEETAVLNRAEKLLSKSVWKNEDGVHNTQDGINHLPLILHKQAARTPSNNDYNPHG